MTKGKSCSRAKVAKVMREYKTGALHSGRSKTSVSSQRQAIAIALSEARRKCGGKRSRK